MRASPYIVASSLLAFSLARSIHQHGPENFLNQPRQALLQKNLLEISQSTKSDCTTGCNTLYGEPTSTTLAPIKTTNHIRADC